MTLLEMSASYRSSAAAIHGRIDELTPLWREARELAALTAHYYDRSHQKHENCTL